MKRNPASAEPASPKAKPAPPQKRSASSQDRFPIVGIGASAGGLEALEQFFANVPEKIGMGFIVVPHLDPSHASLMTELLRRVTKLAVDEAREGTRVQSDHVYVIPPNKDMTIDRGTLRLGPPKQSHGLRMPIDSFFRSLADDQGNMAVGIVLSGTGTDGTLGLRAIHGAGGMIMAQTPTTAKYAGMPGSAAQTGLVDFVLPPDKMPAQLKSYSHKFGRKIRIPAPREDRLRRILAMIRSHTGHDFSLYKKPTLQRRIEKHMNLKDITDISAYQEFLQDNPNEISLLAQEFLIAVTQFFRDPEAFDCLKAQFARYAAGLPDGSLVRAWVPGCGTGEEAFSIAMLISECMEEIKRDLKVQIFATDIDEEAITRARAGIYADNIAGDVTPARLRRFFVHEERGYRVRKEIRETIVYAVQDLTKDPPFTRLDLLSCRNLLIYLEAELQNRLLPLFHYSLKPGGLLFLGSSESIGKYTDLFDTAEKKAKIFEAKRVFPQAADEPWSVLPWVHAHPMMSRPDELTKPKEMDISLTAQHSLLERFAPPSVIANDKGEILFIHGQTGKYLEPAQGRPVWNIFEMAREGLRLELRSGIHQALTKGKDRRFENLQVRTNHETEAVNLTIRPFGSEKELSGLAIISFEDVVKAEMPKGPAKGRKAGKDQDNRLHEAERELSYTRESLQATIEELQAANEELKSTNEEMQSTNEELQSTNEELETSREELQSMNEELITVNSELQAKIDQQSQTENDMRLLLDNTNIGIVFLDDKLAIKRFTTEVTKIFKLIPGDIGRPIRDIRSSLDPDVLEDDVRAVMTTMERREREIQIQDGQRYLMRIMPYRAPDGRVSGVVITFTNDNRTERVLDGAGAAPGTIDYSGYEQQIGDLVRAPVLIVDANDAVLSANEAMRSALNLKTGDILGRRIFEVPVGPWNDPRFVEFLNALKAGGSPAGEAVLSADLPGRGTRNIIVRGRRLERPGWCGSAVIVLALDDVTPVVRDVKA